MKTFNENEVAKLCIFWMLIGAMMGFGFHASLTG